MYVFLNLLPAEVAGTPAVRFVLSYNSRSFTRSPTRETQTILIIICRAGDYDRTAQNIP